MKQIAMREECRTRGLPVAGDNDKLRKTLRAADKALRNSVSQPQNRVSANGGHPVGGNNNEPQKVLRVADKASPSSLQQSPVGAKGGLPMAGDNKLPKPLRAADKYLPSSVSQFQSSIGASVELPVAGNNNQLQKALRAADKDSPNSVHQSQNSVSANGGLHVAGGNYQPRKAPRAVNKALPSMSQSLNTLPSVSQSLNRVDASGRGPSRGPRAFTESYERLTQRQLRDICRERGIRQPPTNEGLIQKLQEYDSGRNAAREDGNSIWNIRPHTISRDTTKAQGKAPIPRAREPQMNLPPTINEPGQSKMQDEDMNATKEAEIGMDDLPSYQQYLQRRKACNGTVVGALSLDQYTAAVMRSLYETPEYSMYIKDRQNAEGHTRGALHPYEFELHVGEKNNYMNAQWSYMQELEKKESSTRVATAYEHYLQASKTVSDTLPGTDTAKEVLFSFEEFRMLMFGMPVVRRLRKIREIGAEENVIDAGENAVDTGENKKHD
ncbi:hypothetical protein MMC28_009155 [Mycoblastus sanguinarius]|nr:hypothetical protein [Mycoblastus sanguinarius]